MLLEVVANALYYNPALTLQVLEAKGHTAAVFTLWFRTIPKFKECVYTMSPQMAVASYKRILQQTVKGFYSQFPLSSHQRSTLFKATPCHFGAQKCVYWHPDFSRFYDKKLVILGLTSVFGMGYNNLPQLVQHGSKQILDTLIKLIGETEEIRKGNHSVTTAQHNNHKTNANPF